MQIIKLFFFFLFFIFLSGANSFAGYEFYKSSDIPLSEEQLKITFIDAYKANCTFIKTPNGKNIIIGGTMEKLSSDLRKNLDERLTIQKSILGFIKNYEYENIDFAILTHPKYIPGLRDIIYNYDVKKVYVPHYSYENDAYRKFLEELKKNDIHYYTIRDDKLELSDSLKIEVFRIREFSKENNSEDIENILKISYKNFGILLPGNNSPAAINKLIETYPASLKSAVLKISRYSSFDILKDAKKFIDTSNPQQLIIFTDPENKGNKEFNTIIEDYKNTGINIFRNDYYNTLSLKSGKLKETYNTTLTVRTDGKNYKIISDHDLDKIRKDIPAPPNYNYKEITREELTTEPNKVNLPKPDVVPLLNEEYYDAARGIIGRAKESIYMVMFFVNMGDSDRNPVNRLVQKLIDARMRGVRVKILLEKPKREDDFVNWNNMKVLRWLQNYGIEVRMNDSKIKAHNKFLVVDRKYTIIGNHNWSKTALDGSQNEVAALINSENTAGEFIKYYYEKSDENF